MLRKIFLSLAFGLAASCAVAQTAPSPADVGVSKGTPDVFKLKGHDNVWTPFGSVDPSTHVYIPGTNGTIAPNDCVKWGPGLTSAGAACNSVTGGAHPANQLTIYTNHAGLLANVTTPTEAWTIVQQGFYAPGDGGEATYNWDATSLCPGGYFRTPTIPADGLSCVLPVGQSPSTPGRYILSLTNGNINVRQFGMKPDDGSHFDNSPFVGPMILAIGKPNIGPTGPEIYFPATFGPTYTTYYFSEPFELTKGASLNCGTAANSSQFGSKAQLLFPAGVPGVIQEGWYLSSDGGADTGSAIIGCGIGSAGKFGSVNSSPPNGNGDTGSNIFRNLNPAPPIGWPGSPFPLLAPNDGVIAIGPGAINGAPLLQPGAYIQSVSAGTTSGQNITLASPYVIGKQETIFGAPASQAAALYRLPANEKYQVTTTAGSSNAVVTGGRRPLKVGTWIWSEAFVFGTVIMSQHNQVTGTPMVNSGGSGYGTGSGTMTWSGPGCGPYNGLAHPAGVNPVLNVTASGGVITAVTGVASAGECNGAWPAPGATTWTPGGGLSAGSGASFNLAFQNNVIMSTMAASSQLSPALTGKTGTYNLWALNAGLMRRTGAGTRSAMVQMFPIELELYCDQGGGFHTGCANSSDENGAFMDGLIGRYVTGSDCSPSLSMGNIYGRNFISDIVESCTLESTYVNENTNSPENDVAKYSLLSLCGFNTSVFIGGYWASNQYTDGICLGYDVNSNVNIGVPTIPLDIANQNSMLSIGVGGIFGTALLGSGGRNQGQFTYGGYFSKIETTNAPTAVGGTTISLGSIFGMLASGYTITDLTNPTAIPSGTTVTAVNRGAVNVTISNPVASPGVAASDKINFSVTSGPAPCLGIVGGVDLLFSMSTTCFNGSPNDDFALKYDPSVRAWTLGSTLNSFLWIPTSGYAGYDPTGVVAPYGFAIGSAESYGVGRERTIDISTAAFSNDSHREGDVRFNRQPTPGGNLAWSWASAFTTTFSAPVAVGATTATVAACPSPALPAGTPIDYANFDDRKPVGDLASCVGTTLTFQAPAVAAATSGWQAMFMQSRQAAHIANDAAGTSWPVATLANVSGLAPCNATTVGFGVAYDGETYAAKGYGTAVAGGGATHRPVFCDGTSWTYH